MIDQTAQRTMQVPGQGIIPAGRPTVDHKEYPKHMAHPQFQPGKPGPEIKSPHGFTYNAPGTPIRFPPVLVKTRMQEEYHMSQGYVTVGKSDPDAFNRAVGSGQIPDQTAYVPMEYPKWVLGKLVHSREEEDRLFPPDTMLVTRQGSSEPLVDPAVNTEVATLLDRPDIDTGGPVVNVLKAPEKSLDQLRIEDLEAKVDHMTLLLATAMKAQNPPFAPGETGDREPIIVPRKVNQKKSSAKKTAPKLSDPQKQARSDAIKAGMARKRALSEANSSQHDASVAGLE